MAIGKILSDVLKERNTTVTDLARNINVAPTTIYSIIERDNMKIDISVLIKICKSLDVDIEMFYKDYLDNNDSDKTVSEIMFKYTSSMMMARLNLTNALMNFWNFLNTGDKNQITVFLLIFVTFLQNSARYFLYYTNC